MALPKVYAPIESVDVAGERYELRVLTRAEAARFQKMLADGATAAELEIAVIAAATDTPVDETRDWYAATPGWVVGELVAAIQKASRLDGEAQKSGAASDSAGGG